MVIYALLASILPVPFGFKLILVFVPADVIVTAPVLPKILSVITLAVAVTFALAVILALATIAPAELIETSSILPGPEL